MMTASATSTTTDPRKERARATRRRMVEAAYRLFCERGFNVPLTAIAAEAGVAVQTLYFTFHTKVGLLQEALQFAVHGDDLPTPPHERAWFAAMVLEPDPQRAILLMLQGTQGVYDRVGPLAGIFQTGEADVANMWRHSEQLRYHGMGIVVSALLEKGQPRSGVDVTTATDMVFVLLSPPTYQAFIAEREWAVEQWQAWTADTLVQAIFQVP